VRNYIVMTWCQADMNACTDLNLPCTLLPESLMPDKLGKPEAPEGLFEGHDYMVGRRAGGRAGGWVGFVPCGL
jgi:hypothetical protein